MKINTNTWNKIRYTIYAPAYDLIAGYFNDSRKKSIDSLKIKSGDKVLIIGVGTGLDLNFLLRDCKITAIDITPRMISKVKERNKILNRNVEAMVMDGQSLKFNDNSFDFVILHLILAVIPDPLACIKETERVLKPGGMAIVFDKFLPKGKKVSLCRIYLNIFTNFLFSEINRDFESIISNSGLKILSDSAANFNGNFRFIKIMKKDLSINGVTKNK